MRQWNIFEPILASVILLHSIYIVHITNLPVSWISSREFFIAEVQHRIACYNVIWILTQLLMLPWLREIISIRVAIHFTLQRVGGGAIMLLWLMLLLTGCFIICTILFSVCNKIIEATIGWQYVTRRSVCYISNIKMSVCFRFLGNIIIILKIMNKKFWVRIQLRHHVFLAESINCNPSSLSLYYASQRCFIIGHVANWRILFNAAWCKCNYIVVTCLICVCLSFLCNKFQSKIYII